MIKFSMDVILWAPQNDHLNLIFVKDSHVLCQKWLEIVLKWWFMEFGTNFNASDVNIPEKRFEIYWRNYKNLVKTWLSKKICEVNSTTILHFVNKQKIFFVRFITFRGVSKITEKLLTYSLDGPWGVNHGIKKVVLCR